MSDTNEARSGHVGDRRVRRGQVVAWEGAEYRVQRRRAVDGFAMFQTDTHEVFLAALNGGEEPGWVGENECGPAEA